LSRSGPTTLGVALRFHLAHWHDDEGKGFTVADLRESLPPL
jgi:hypothetical protein